MLVSHSVKPEIKTLVIWLVKIATKVKLEMKVNVKVKVNWSKIKLSKLKVKVTATTIKSESNDFCYIVFFKCVFV